MLFRSIINYSIIQPKIMIKRLYAQRVMMLSPSLAPIDLNVLFVCRIWCGSLYLKLYVMCKSHVIHKMDAIFSLSCVYNFW